MDERLISVPCQTKCGEITMSITEREAIAIGMKLAEENNLVFEYVHRFPEMGNLPAMYVVNCYDRDGE